MIMTKTTDSNFFFLLPILLLLLVPATHVVLGDCTCDIQAQAEAQTQTQAQKHHHSHSHNHNRRRSESSSSSSSSSSSVKYKLIAIASILVAGGVGVCLPQFGREFKALRAESDVFFMVKAFAAGVILATGYIHILPDAFDNLTSPSLRTTPWADFPFTGLVAMMSSLATLMLDTFATGYYNRLHFASNNRNRNRNSSSTNKSQQRQDEVMMNNGGDQEMISSSSSSRVSIVVGVEEEEEEEHHQGQGHVHIRTHATHGHAHGSTTNNIPSSDHHREILTLDLIRSRIISQVVVVKNRCLFSS